MVNPRLKNNPLMSLWLSNANRIVGAAEGGIVAETKRQATVVKRRTWWFGKRAGLRGRQQPRRDGLEATGVADPAGALVALHRPLVSPSERHLKFDDQALILP